MSTTASRLRAWAQVAMPVIVAAALLCLAVANVGLRRSFEGEVEDGVLWAHEAGAIVAKDLAEGGPGARAGVRIGDRLLQIDGRDVSATADIEDRLHAVARGERIGYTLARLTERRVISIEVDPVPQGNRALYYVLAITGIFTLLVGTAVRLRRPQDPATLHFFWLTVAFFGVLSYSFSGRLDTLDWVFYWGDVIAMSLLPPLFVHFALVFPDRPSAWVRSEQGSRLLPALYLPAALLGGARVALFVRGVGGDTFADLMTRLDMLELLHLSLSLTAGLAIMTLTLARLRSVTARRQLRWIVSGTAIGALPFVAGYAVPYALGFSPLAGFEYSAALLGLVPLAFASAIVRWRLMDVEVIIKRTLAYAAGLAAVAAIYGILLQIATDVFLEGDATDQHSSVIALLATIVVVLLANPLRSTIQNALDRLYYRDRYDYRRALVAFARDLNSDLDLQRLSERLVARVRDTLVVERMALLAFSESDGGQFRPLAAHGFPAGQAVVEPGTELAARLRAGHIVVIDDGPAVSASRRLPTAELLQWRDLGVHAFVPCVAKEGTIAAMAVGRKQPGEPLSSEDLTLLVAVAGQVATAVENARLYRQVRQKADEIDRLREFSDSVLESLNEGLLVVDLADRVVRWNREMDAMYGLGRADAVGQTIDAVFDATFVTSLRAARRDSESGTATLFRVPLASRHPGRPRALLLNIALAPLRTPDGATTGSIIVLQDISSRVQLEEQLQISEKMASIGLLAAGVAHEVNTPLTGISSYTQMLLENADPDDPKTKVLEKIERQTFRAAKIVNGLLNLARPSQGEALQPVDMNAVVNDVLALLEHQFKTSSIQVRKELSASTPIVQGIEYKLQQVLLNLFLNARDAMPKGGWVSISTRFDNGFAAVEVSDTGVGIPGEHLARIYDPFFTTKSIGRGTGLGLSITYGIVQEHGGTLACDSAVGKGTRFTLMLPLAQARAGGIAN
ncbi:MAG: ATP-binding protein [Acidobacteriota bacterium]|nr:ATP-binding protein [Acidobacteriota bacterium]